jgi:hypothetical protein
MCATDQGGRASAYRATGAGVRIPRTVRC